MIGYVSTEETSPGVHKEVVTERAYVGDILRNNQRWEESQQLNDNFTISSRFSIVADAFAYENFPLIRYVVYMNSKWKINTVEIQRPRIILNIGGIYNG
jgi:hypothetical protein